MRLAPAIALDDLVEGFHGPEERAARRQRRLARKAARKNKKLARMRRETAQARQQAGVPARQRVKARRAAAPGRAAPQQEARLQPAASPWAEVVPEVVDAAWDLLDPGADFEDEDGFDDDAELEGVGLRLRRRPRSAPVARVAQPAAWGPLTRMGRNTRVQAAQGFRAAVIELKPGLFLVAELPEAVTRPEFGFAPLLAPLMMNAAKGAIDTGVQTAQGRGPLASLFRPRQAARRPVRAVRVRRAEAQAAAAPAAPAAPPALPGPVAAPLALPGPVAGDGSFVVAAPNLGWADDHDVATTLGCEACDGGCRR